MTGLSEKKFYKENITKEWLQTAGFRYNRVYSDKDNEVYTYRFSVHKYKSISTLDCEILLFKQNGEMRLNVYDSRLENVYPLFYVSEGVNDKILKEINNKIKFELKKLGIEESGNDKNRKYGKFDKSKC